LRALKAETFIKYGGRTLSFTLPKGWRLVKVAVPREEPKAVDELEAVKSSLQNPVSASLQNMVFQGARVTIIVDDKTRPTPTHKILPILLDKLNSLGVSDRNIKIVVALGLHSENSWEELERKLGGEVLSRVEVYNHNPNSNLSYLGETSRGTPVYVNRHVVEADVRIGVGSISPHPAAGYSGGPKIILPGVSGKTTIYKNHSFFREPSAVIGKLEGNPVFLDEVEAARMARLDFIVNTILDSSGRIMKVFSGDPVEAFRRGVSFFKGIYQVSAPAVDVSIVSSYPVDIDLFQSFKAAFAASLTTRRGGVIILVSPCSEGVRKEHYETVAGLGLHKLNCEELYRAVEEGKLPDYVFGLGYYKLRKMIEGKRMIVVTDGIPGRKLGEMGFEHAKNIEEAFEMAGFREAEVLVAPYGAKILLKPEGEGGD